MSRKWIPGKFQEGNRFITHRSYKLSNRIHVFSYFQYQKIQKLRRHKNVLYLATICIATPDGDDKLPDSAEAMIQLGSISGLELQEYRLMGEWICDVLNEQLDKMHPDDPDWIEIEEALCNCGGSLLRQASQYHV